MAPDLPTIDLSPILDLAFKILIGVPRFLWGELNAGTLFTHTGSLGFATDFYYSLAVVSALISATLFYGALYSFVNLVKIRAEEEYKLKHPEEHAPVEGIPAEEKKLGSLKWQVIEKHISSENPGDWRLAVLEADILLDEMVRGFGYPGINLGERLKSASRDTFGTLDQAWEAHKIRNAIAHEGASFELGSREARRVINLYRAVFEEFNYI